MTDPAARPFSSRQVPLVLALCLCLAGCKGDAGPKERVFVGAGSWAIPPAYTGNPWAPQSVGCASWYVHEPLFYYLPTRESYLPRLGVEAVESRDGRRLSVRLRKGVTWHDGKPFTSRDVAATFQLGAIHGWQVWQRLQGIETPDEHTVVFAFKKPLRRYDKIRILTEKITSPFDPYQEWAAQALPLIGRAAATAEKQALREKLCRYRPPLPIGTGPFRVVNVTSSEMLLERFPDGWARDKLKIDKIKILRGLKNEIMWAFIMAGEIDASSPATPRDVAEQVIKRNPGTKLVCPSDLHEFGFIFNLRKKPMSDVNFRKAFAHAVDRERVTKISYYYSRPVTDYNTGIVRSERDRWLSAEFLRKLDKYEYDPRKAMRILDEAGYRKGKDGYYRDPDGAPMELEISSSENTDWVLGAEVATSLLNKIGVKSKVRIVMGALYGTNLRDGDFDVAVEFGPNFARFGLPVLSYERLYYKSEFMRRATGIADKVRGPGGGTVDLSATVERLHETRDEKERRELIEKLAWITHEHIPFLSVYEKNLMVFVVDGKRVRGWPGVENPVWSNVSYGVEGALVSFMIDGTLEGIPR
ncbi:MAG: ABC transporter substrate-binding protein [Elusimicrobiota bacterium]